MSDKPRNGNALDIMLWCAEINEEMHEQALAEVKSLRALNEIMLCGHLSRYVYPPDGDERTRFCLVCYVESLHIELPHDTAGG